MNSSPNIFDFIDNLDKPWPIEERSKLSQGQKSAWLGQQYGGTSSDPMSIEDLIEKISNILKCTQATPQNSPDCDKIHQFMGRLRSIDCDQSRLDHIANTFQRVLFPVHNAVREGNLAHLESLLSSGFDPSAKDLNNKRPLDIALAERNTPLVHFLCQRGTDKHGAIREAIPEKITVENVAETKEILKILRAENFSANDEYGCQSLLLGLINSDISREDKCEIVLLFKQLGVTQRKDFANFLFYCLDCFDYDLLKIVIELGGANAASKKRVYDAETSTLRTLVQELVMHYMIATDSTSVKNMLKYLIEKCMIQITAQDISWAFSVAPEDIFIYLTEKVNGTFTLADFNLVMKDSLYTPDIDRMEILTHQLKIMPDASTLDIAIQHNNPQLVAWLLRRRVHPKSWDESWQLGVTTGNLTILRLLSALRPEKTLLDRLINLDNLNETELQRYFLNSDLKEMQDFMNALREKVRCATLNHSKTEQLLEMITRVEKGSYEWGTLIARLPDPLLQGEINRTYNLQNLEDYTKSQVSFGQYFQAIVEETLKQSNVQMLPLEEILKSWALQRADFARQRGNNNADSYSSFRTDSRPPLTGISHFHTLSRYSFVFPTICKMMKCGLVDKYFELKTNGCETNCFARYTLRYKSNQISDMHQLTTIEIKWGGEVAKDTRFDWEHPIGSTVVLLLPELEKLHREVMEFKVSRNNPESIKDFQRLVAKAYWLGCNLMITSRGNAQYFMMWLNFVHRYHQLTPLIPRLGTTMPDCLAISQPMEDFINHFPDYFENG